MMVADAVSATLKRIRKPEYMGITVRIAGADIISSNELETLEHVVSGKGGGQYWKRNRAAEPPPLLASATRNEPRPREALLVTVPSSALSFGGHNESGLPLLSVGVHLISPDLLFKQQQERPPCFAC